MKIVLAALILLGSAAAAGARLGETQGQIEQRYGKVIQRGSIPEIGTNAWHFYEASKMTVAVQFTPPGAGRQGVSAAEFYRAIDPETLSERLINALLEAQAQGSRWEEVEQRPELAVRVKVWARADGRAVALRHRWSGGMLICTPEAYRTLDHAADAEARAKLKGF